MSRGREEGKANDGTLGNAGSPSFQFKAGAGGIICRVVPAKPPPPALHTLQGVPVAGSPSLVWVAC